MNKLSRTTSRILGKLALATTALGVASHAGAHITVKGSDTMVILAQKWAEVYMVKNPEVRIQVTGGGSGTGVAALLNKGTDLANSSRPMRPAEVAECLRTFNHRPTEYKVALDGITLYVHESNPVKDLSLDQLRDIFVGKIRNWKEVGGPDTKITVYSRENSSGTYEFFKEHVLLGRDLTSRAQTMPGTAAVLEAVAKDRTGIGYGGTAYGKGARHVAVRRERSSEPIDPTEETVVRGTYPIWRFLYVYVNPDLDKGEVASYIRWMRSDEGQQVVKDMGYFPLPDRFRAR
jgi:phosphate transport system substrate-binding protein